MTRRTAQQAGFCVARNPTGATPVLQGAGAMPEPTETTTTTGATRDANATEPTTTETAPLGESGKAALDAERAARKAAEKDLKRLQAEIDTAVDAKRKDEEAAAAKRGEFEQLATTREQERDTVISERDALKAENDKLRESIATVLDADWKALPDEVRDAYLGADDDPLARLVFLPKGKALAARLATVKANGNGPNPPAAGGNGAPTLDQTMKEMRQASGLRSRSE